MTNYVLVIQNDRFFLPEHLPKLLVFKPPVLAIVLGSKPSHVSRLKMLKHYFALFGFVNSLKLVLMTLLRIIKKDKDVSSILREHKVPTVFGKRLTKDLILKNLRCPNANILVSVACPEKISPSILASFPLGGINLHGGYLPDFPGVFSAFWCLYKQSRWAGCTIHFISDEFDSGPILKRKRFAIDSSWSMFDVYHKVTEKGVSLLIQSLEDTGHQKMIKPSRSKIRQNYNSFPTLREGWAFRRRGLKVL